MQATHQELQLANAQHLSQYVSLNYNGVPGLLVGGAVFTGKAAVPTFPARTARPARDLVGGRMPAGRPGPRSCRRSMPEARSPTRPRSTSTMRELPIPFPSEFLGYYVQGAYTVWQQRGYRLAPFVRWEHYDMAACL